MTTAQSHADITYLNHRYADAVCRRDAEQWAGTWAEDAVWELGKGRRVEGRDAIVEMWNGAMDRFCAVVQNVVNAAFDIDDQAGSATGRSYIMEHWHRSNGDKGILLAYYDDTYTRTDGGWLYASRELVPSYSGPPDLSAPFLNAWSEPSA